MNKIKNFFLKIYYSLPFGMKAADAEIMGGGTQDGSGVEINQEVSDERVGHHLLKGEVTQAVEELRYRTYAVANKAENFKYLGNGVAIAEKAERQPQNKTAFKFTQENENICETVLETLKQVGSYGVERYRFEINYKSFVRFKIEKYATKVDVRINDKEGSIVTVLHFNREPNPYDAVSKPFINELSKLLFLKTPYEIERNEITSSIESLSFSTYKAKGEDNFVTYSFMGGSKFDGFEEKEHDFLLTFSWNQYIRVPLDLENKYYSKSMAEKYEKKERKDNPISVAKVERKRHCSVCGKEMSVYDGDIQEANGEKPICTECLKKALK